MEIRPSEFVGTRRKAALRGEAYAWVLDFRSLDKLREVRVSSYLSFTLCLSVFTMFELIEAMSGRLIGPKTWDRNVRIFFEPSLCSPWELGAVWASLVMFYAINDALMCIKPEMAVKFGFTK